MDSSRLSKIEIPEPVIQKGDLLSITVYSDDPLATAAVTNPSAAMVNSTGSSEGGKGTQTGATSAMGFVVSQSGEIQMYKLGSIVAEGKTKKQLGDTLTLLYASQGLLKNPFVDVRFVNYKVTIIGEVTRPGPVSIPTDKLSAFDAIGMAGDITVYGRRDNVLVVREVNGVRQFGRLNLQDPNVFLSPYYYLQQNDLVVIDVNKNKSAMNNQNKFQTMALATSLLSITSILISLFSR